MTDAAESLLCRGMRDLLPDEMARFRAIESAFRRICARWGYQEVRTPTLEHLYLFTSAGTLAPQVLSDVYSFLDWDGWTGERVVLRPDATIPVARLYRERLSEPLSKLSYVSNTFRFLPSEQPRERWQCGVELIGASWPAGDLELLLLALQLAQALQLPRPVLVLSHPGIMRALLEQAGFDAAAQAELYDQLLDGAGGVEQVVAGIEARLPALAPALRVLTGSTENGSGFLANLHSVLLPVAPAVGAPLAELELIARAAEAEGAQVEVSVTAVRDFEYYTGVVFGLICAGTTVFGGGRYDRLVTTAGQDGSFVPACGFAAYVDLLLPYVRHTEAAPPAVVEVCPAAAYDQSLDGLAAAARIVLALQAAGVGAALTPSSTTRWCVLVEPAAGGTQLYLQDRRHRSASGVAINSLAAVIAAVREL